MKLTTGHSNASGDLLLYYAQNTGLDKTWLLETGLLNLIHARENWVFCPACETPVACTLLPGIEGGEVRCRGCGEVVVVV